MGSTTMGRSIVFASMGSTTMGRSIVFASMDSTTMGRSIVFALNGLYHNGQINDIFCLNGIYYNGYRMLLFCPTTIGRLFIVSLFCVTEGFTGVVVVFACTTCGIFNTCVDHRITYLVRNMFVYNLKH
jgi:hypothetical protein